MPARTRCWIDVQNDVAKFINKDGSGVDKQSEAEMKDNPHYTVRVAYLIWKGSNSTCNR